MSHTKGKLKHIDPDKFRSSLAEIEEKIKPCEAILKSNPEIKSHWDAVKMAIDVISKAVELATVEITEKGE